MLTMSITRQIRYNEGIMYGYYKTRLGTKEIGVPSSALEEFDFPQIKDEVEQNNKSSILVCSRDILQELTRHGQLILSPLDFRTDLTRRYETYLWSFDLTSHNWADKLNNKPKCVSKTLNKPLIGEINFSLRLRCVFIRVRQGFHVDIM